MLICDLVKAFCDWVSGNKTYTNNERAKNINKFIFYWLMSAIILFIMYINDYAVAKNYEGMYDYFNILLWIDIFFYIIRFFNLRNGYNEPNMFMFLHMILHCMLVYIAIDSIVRWASFDKATSKPIEDMQIIFYFLYVRVLIYAMIILIVAVFWPCILCSIINDIRRRNNLYGQIRFARNTGSLLLSDFNNDNNLEAQMPLNNADFFQPANNNVMPRRQTVGDRLAGLIQNNLPAAPAGDFFSKLRRVKYETEGPHIGYEECSICIFPFGEYPDEDLIYLPCNRKHIYHENCIIEWLKRQPDCPLCKAPVNNNTINRY